MSSNYLSDARLNQYRTSRTTPKSQIMRNWMLERIEEPRAPEE
jgi:hypothetical protein